MYRVFLLLLLCAAGCKSTQPPPPPPPSNGVRVVAPGVRVDVQDGGNVSVKQSPVFGSGVNVNVADQPR